MIKDIKKFAHDVLVPRYHLDVRLANDWQFLRRLQELVDENSYFSDTFIGLDEGTITFTKDGSMVYESIAQVVGKGHFPYHCVKTKELHTRSEEVYYVKRREVHQLDETCRPGEFVVRPEGKWAYVSDILTAYYDGICEAQYNAVSPRKKLDNGVDIVRFGEISDEELLKLPVLYQNLLRSDNKKSLLDAEGLQSICLSSRDEILVEAVNCHYIGIDGDGVKDIQGRRLLGTKNGLSTFDLRNSKTFKEELPRCEIDLALLHELGSDYRLSPIDIINNEARVNVLLAMLGRIRRPIPLRKFKQMITTKYADGMLARDDAGSDYKYVVDNDCNLRAQTPNGQKLELK